MLHKESRFSQFELIKKLIDGNEIFTNNKAIAVLGDSLDVIKSLPSSSISLILTDPPYHSTKKIILLMIEHLILTNNLSVGWNNILLNGKEY